MRSRTGLAFNVLVITALLGLAVCGDDGSGRAADAATPRDAAAPVDAASPADAAPPADAASGPDAGLVCDPPATANQVYQFEARSLSETRTVSLCEYRGEVLLIANIAALCGYTPQLGVLAELQTAYGNLGFRVLGFYSDQFGQQAGSEEQRGVCETNYGVNFPTFEIVDVNGPNAHPLFVWLKAQDGGGDLLWNFEKFLIARDGTFLERWRSAVEPDDPQITSSVETALQASP